MPPPEPLRPAPEFEADIVDLTHDGRGVARVEGKAVFVTDALPGERVRARTVRRHKQFDEAALLEVLVASPDRVGAECAHYGTCGGCALQHLAPAAQVASKERTLLENLARIGGLEPERVLPALRSPSWGYRRRGRLSVKHVLKKGRVLVGFRERDGRFVADLARCAVVHPAIGDRLAGLAALVASLDAPGAIPQIEFAAGDAAAALVFRHMDPLSAGDLAKLRAFAADTGLVVYLQPGGTDSVHPLDAPAALSFALPAHGLSLDFEPLDFVQINAAMNAAMIDHALALLEPAPTDRVLDLFCGLGNFTLPIARHAAQVTGVEGDAALIERARANARRNGLANVDYEVADLFGDHRAAPWASAAYDRVLLDPPRAGAIEALAYLPGPATHRVVYVSCHPASLARDAKVLVEQHGFALRAAGVMDMFPHTAHVESIAQFERVR